MEEKRCDYVAELAKNGVIAFVPKGNSMWPTLKDEKQSVIVKRKTEKLRPMDVALYKRDNGANVLHRVMKTTDSGYIMCGDSQFVFEKVEEDNVYGVMVGFYRGKRYIDVNDAEYIEKVQKWYRHKALRRFNVKTFFFFKKIRCMLALVILKIFRSKRLKQGEKDDGSD